MNLSKRLCWALLFSLVVSRVAALPDDANQRSEIFADQNVFDFKTRTTTFYGNVVFQQGSLKINADKLIYYGKFDADNPSSTDKIVATGNPARFQQRPKLDAAPVKAVANRLEYAVKAETLFLIDDASLDQDGSSLSGNRIEYDVKKAVVKASGKKSKNGDDGRVRMVIPPKLFQNDKGAESKAAKENTVPAQPEEKAIEALPEEAVKPDASAVANTEPSATELEPSATELEPSVTEREVADQEHSAAAAVETTEQPQTPKQEEQ